jgi:hypothetical protein
MTSDSPLFDSIRIKPRGKAKAEKPKAEAPPCGWEGCEKKGEHRAPKGRDQEGEFHWFCLEHVQAYNKSYNYFSGMNDEDLTKYQKASMTGHRPTWEWGRNGKAETVKKRRGPKPTASGKPRKPWADDAGADPFALFGDAGEAAPKKPGRQTRTVGNAARKSFSPPLGLTPMPTQKPSRPASRILPNGCTRTSTRATAALKNACATSFRPTTP